MAFFKTRSAIGIDLDAYEVRAAEVGGTAEKPSLLGLGRAALPNGTVKDGKVNKPEVLRDVIAKLWQDSQFTSRNVILGVSNQDVIVRFATIPKVQEDKLENFVRFQAQDFLPISVNDVELDYIALNEVQDEKQTMLRLLLVAGRKSMLNNFVSAINGAGLRLQDIDVSILALARIIKREKKAFVALNHTKEQIALLIINQGLPAFARILSTYKDVPSQENYFTNTAEREIAATAEINIERNNSGTLNDEIIGEIRSSVAYYQSQNPGIIVEKCIISSTESSKSNTSNSLREKLGIEVEMVDPLRWFNFNNQRGGNSFYNTSDFSVCISLAMRGLEGNKA